MITYYQFIPIWKDNSRQQWATFVGNNSIINTKFKTIEDGLESAKLDGTALREQNWEIYECHVKFFSTIKTRIMLKSLYNKGYLGTVIEKDDISECYTHK